MIFQDSNSVVKGVGISLRNVLAGGLLVAASGLSMMAQVNVTTWRNDIGRTGQNLNETILNPTNVNPTQFGLLFTQPVDGFVYAQPLYMPNVTIASQSHNVVFVATENDSVYAFDADNNGGTNANPLWFASMLSTAHGAAVGATTVSSSVVGTDIVPQVGITGTPVIDPTTGTLYVVSATEEGANFYLRLHALDITSGAEKFNGPMVITATVPGTGNGSSGGSLTFDPEWENQRPGLLLLNGVVYVAFASHGDNGPWHGWIFGYNAATLQQTGVFCASPNGVGSGIWMGGAGLAADVVDPVNHPYGRMFVPTGNGDFTAAKPFTSAMDFGDTIINLDLTNGVPTAQDSFTPYDQANLDAEDGDQGSGGLLIVPTQTTGNYPHLLVQTGKTGTLYNLNRDNLGGYNASGDVVLQNLPYTIGDNGAWTMPAYWNGNVYYWGTNDTLKEFSIVNGLLKGPTAKSSETYGYPGANPVISANGTTEGIVWTIESDAYTSNGPAVLQAHNAASPATTLYSSATNAARDNPGPAVKFTAPTVVNGKVYVGTQTQVGVYGLIGAQPLTATPVLTPGTESFSGSLSVVITDATAGSTIYYTTDGSTPTAASAVYTNPVAVSSTATIQAIASAPGYDQSAVGTATYTDASQVATPVISPGSGIVTAAFSATITDATTGSTIYYTTDGSTPTTASTQYTAPVSVTATETLNAIAAAPSLINSAVASASYTFNTGGLSFPVGFAGSQSILILNGSTDLDDSRLQITNGALNEAGSAWYYQPVNVQAFTTEFSFQLSNPAGNGITFTIQGNGTTALGQSGSGLGYEGIANSVAIKFDFNTVVGSGTDSTGLYENGAIPTVPAIDLSTSGINLLSDDTMDVKLAYNGTVLSMTITDLVTGAAYTTSWTVNIPSIVGGNTAYVGFTGGSGTSSSSQKMLTWTYSTGSTALPLTTSPAFSPAGGNYATAPTVSITSLTSGASIYYTTNGTAPTTSSTLYSAPISVSSSEKLEAIAVAPSYASSAVATAAYTIAPSLPAPTFSLAGGTYFSTQSVTITDSTPGTTIYYTTNGTTPTTSAAIYTGPISVTASETLEAIAVESGYANSPATSAIYTISSRLPTPTFSPAAGNYTTTQTVTLSDQAGATIYYTTNGTTPTTSSTIYTGPIAVDWTQTIQAIAVEAGATNSSVGTSAYGINLGGTNYINYPSGGISATNLSLNFGPTVTNGLLQLTDGNTGEFRTAWYNTEVPVGTFITDFTFQQLNATADGFTFAIQSGNPYELGYSGGGLAYQSIPNSVAVKFDLYNNNGEGSDSTGLYTDGAAPTVPSVDLSSTGINLHSGDVMHAHMTYDGTNLTMVLTDTVTNATVTEIFPANIPNLVGGTTAYVGFTAASGAASAVQNILSWSFESPAQTTPATSAPAFSPVAGTYSTAQTVTITSATSGATIYYTTNGTTPTTSSSVYSGPITVSATETLEAIAVASGYTTSSTSSAAYTIGAALPAPAFSVAAGTYATAQTVTISDSTAGATFYYTTNGTTPTTSSTLYSGPITVSSTETLEAIAVETGYSNSPATSAAYTITSPLPAPAFSIAAGTYATAQTVAISDSTAGATFYYTTNGTTPTTSSTLYSGPITVNSTETLEAIAVETGYTNSPASSVTYTITPQMPAPIFSVAAGTYNTAQTVTLSDSVAGASIYYSLNSTTPTTSSTLYKGPISIGNSETLNAIAVETGYTTSTVASAAYILVASNPVITPAGGTYSVAQTVTVTSATPTAHLYYTTNGITPTASSPAYSGPITISSSETLKVLAAETGFTPSSVISAAYVIAPTAPAPAFSVAAGSYTAAQTVTISDTLAGSTIYYTTTGATPTTSSTVYTGPITISTTETLTAIAVKTGYTNSPTTSAVYTIATALPAPVFSVASGTYSATQTVTISDATSGATFYYTTNGTTPTTSSTLYSGAITVNSTETLEAIAVETGYSNSPAASAVYTISTQLPAPLFSVAAGSYNAAQPVTITDAVAGTTIYYTLNGSTPTTSSSHYTAPFTIGNSATLSAIAVKTGYTTSPVASAVYTLVDANPVLSLAAGTYSSAQTVTITSATPNAKIFYTTNGLTPTASSTSYTGPISVSASETLKAIALNTGFTPSAVVSAAYIITPTAPAPTYSVAAGTYTTAQAVSISDTLAGSKIYYTTNGTTPTTSSTVYNGAITVSSSETVEAIAVKTGYNNSSATSSAYTITP